MKTNLLVALSTATLLFSCNDSISEPPSPVEEPSRTPITTTVPDTSSIVTEAKAMQIALTQLAPQGSRAAETEIKSVESLTDSLGIAQMYIVNFANNRGFVIVSASKDYLPVIAESDHGNFDINNISPDHPVNLWIAEQKFKISHADSFDPEVKHRLHRYGPPLTRIRKSSYRIREAERPTSRRSITTALPDGQWIPISRYTSTKTI